ncbi:hypothetical protein MYX65_04995 [Acidobacteria bacterium AH-259-L09]|nr:hypothetical protein [Acidobacteria bacterium AH-259-L09]
MIGEHIERKLFVEKAPQVIHYIRAVPYGERSGLVAEVYDQLAIAPPQLGFSVFRGIPGDRGRI